MNKKLFSQVAKMMCGNRVRVHDSHFELGGCHGEVVRLASGGASSDGLFRVRLDGRAKIVALDAEHLIVVEAPQRTANDLIGLLMARLSAHADETASRSFGATRRVAAESELASNAAAARRLRTTAAERDGAAAVVRDPAAPNRNESATERLARAARVVRSSAMPLRPALRARVKIAATASLDALATLCQRIEAEGSPVDTASAAVRFIFILDMTESFINFNAIIK